MAKVKTSKLDLKAPKMRPICRTHKKDLAYNPENVRWECPEPNCKSVRYPSIDNDGRPVIGKGKLSLLRHSDSQGNASYYLRTENNVVVQIDDLIVNQKDGVNKVYLTLAFDNEMKIELDG